MSCEAGDSWRDVSLGETLTLQRGFDITRKEQLPGPVPVVSSSGVGSFHSEKRADGPGVVVGRKGSIGTVYFQAGPYWPHDTTLWVKDFKGNDPYFCYLLLRSLNLQELDVGAANPTLNRNHLHRLPVRVPGFANQRRISALALAFDELIGLNERRIDLLEDLARSLYREWFIRFRFPGHERVTRTESPFGPVPEGWEIRTIGDLCDVVRGRSYRRSDLSESGGVPFLNLKCVEREGGFRRSGVKRYTGRYKDSQRAIPGNVLIALTDMTQERRVVAQAFRMPDLGEPFAIPSLDLALLRPAQKIFEPFLYATLRYSGFGDRVKHFANGANVLHLAIERVTEQSVCMPPSEVLSAFGSAFGSLLAQGDVLEAENRHLVATRDLFLPRLVSGKLDIADLDLDGLLAGSEQSDAF